MIEAITPDMTATSLTVMVLSFLAITYYLHTRDHRVAQIEEALTDLTRALGEESKARKETVGGLIRTMAALLNAIKLQTPLRDTTCTDVINDCDKSPALAVLSKRPKKKSKNNRMKNTFVHGADKRLRQKSRTSKIAKSAERKSKASAVVTKRTPSMVKKAQPTTEVANGSGVQAT